MFEKIIQPSADLMDRILSRIMAEKRLKILKKRLFLFAGLLFSGGLVVTLQSVFMWHDAETSGFGAYLKLVFTDMGVLGYYWKDLLWSVLESMPAADLGILFAGIFIISLSVGILSRNIKNWHETKHLILK